MMLPELATPPVELPAFSGPLDLLLHLIRKHELSVYDIPIATICDQYHEYLAGMGTLDLELAGEFLWMASWLLHLKSKLLLPRPQDADEEDPRQELVDRLLEYRRVKDVAEVLYEVDIVRRCLWVPDVRPDLGPEETEVDWEDVDLRLLARTYLETMQRFASSHPPPLQVVPLRFSLRDTMRDLYRRVHDDQLVPLLRLLNSRLDPEEVVVTVVAVLELVRLGGVAADQRAAFTEIYLRPGRREMDPTSFDQEEAADGP